LLVCLSAGFPALSQDAATSTEPPKDLTKETEAGIPVTDPVTLARCGGCHRADANKNLTRISWIRTSPEGWQEAIKRMAMLNGVKLSPEDGRHIVRYLANEHGLAPEETESVRWFLEMWQPQAEPVPNMTLRRACATCHAFVKPRTWRRSAAEWQLLKNMHIGYFPMSQFVAFRPEMGPRPEDPATPRKQPVDEAMEFFSKNYGLYSPEWSNWRAQFSEPDLSGKWFVSANEPGKGKYFGEMTVTKTAPGEYNTSMTLVRAKDGSKLDFPGKAMLYTGYEWRGSAKAEPFGGMRQVMAVAAGQATMKGRWFWGAYQEFGMTVNVQRESKDLTVLGTDVVSLPAGTKGAAMKIFGRSLPSDLSAGDIRLGAGGTVSKATPVSPEQVNVVVDVDPKVFAGKRNIVIRGRAATDAFSVYDRIEYIKITPETALAHVGGVVGKKGYFQFEAHAFSNGADGQPNTPDDVDLGPVPAQWSIEEFISHNSDNDKEFVGNIDDNGLFTPAGDGPNPARRLSTDNVGDVWVVAKYKGANAAKPLLEAKTYLVVTVPDFLRFDAPELGEGK
jgi:quinohemoprotein amine dehydrogenase